MGYHKNAQFEADELDFFLESARADTIDEYYPDLEGRRTTRMLPIDTRGSFEETDGTLYRFTNSVVFVPDDILGMVQPVVTHVSSSH
jgi:hypothetical protein